MSVDNPKIVRRIIMGILYDCFLEDPLRMLSPADLMERDGIERASLAANAYYLHDRKLVEMMMGYNPPLFAAIRISPEGIDLYEDQEAFDRLFPIGPKAKDNSAERVIPLLMELAAEAEAAPLEGIRRQWLLEDLTRLREALRLPEHQWEGQVLLTGLQWLEALIEQESEDHLPTLPLLRKVLMEMLS